MSGHGHHLRLPRRPARARGATSSAAGGCGACEERRHVELLAPAPIDEVEVEADDVDGPGPGAIPNDAAAALCAGVLLLLVLAPAWAARDEPARGWGGGGAQRDARTPSGSLSDGTGSSISMTSGLVTRPRMASRSPCSEPEPSSYGTSRS